MTSDVMYTTGWSFMRGRLALEHQWLSIDEARRMYEADTGEGPMVIDAALRGPNGDPEPRWVIGLGAGVPRVTFLDGAQSIWRQIDWEQIDGRWWRWITYDHEYPNQSRKWEVYEAEYVSKAVVMPDGTGRIELTEGENGPSGVGNSPRLKMRFTNRAVDSYWIDIPQFGDWAALADPGPSTYDVAGLNVHGAEALELLGNQAALEQVILP